MFVEVPFVLGQHRGGVPLVDAVLGFCGVKPMRLSGAPMLNLFYRFDPAARGRGFGTEAAIAVVGWVTRIRPEQKLIARIRPDNTASARVAANAGLVRAPELDAEGEDGPDDIWIYPTHPASDHGPIPYQRHGRASRTPRQMRMFAEFREGGADLP